MEWLKLTEILSSKTAKSSPPTQWIFLIVLIAIAFFAGLSLDRELAEAAVARDALKRKRRYIEELRLKAQAAKSATDAALLLTQISDLKIRLLKQEAAYKRSRASLNDRLIRLRSARNWKELGDA